MPETMDLSIPATWASLRSATLAPRDLYLASSGLPAVPQAPPFGFRMGSSMLEAILQGDELVPLINLDIGVCRATDQLQNLGFEQPALEHWINNSSGSGGAILDNTNSAGGRIRSGTHSLETDGNSGSGGIGSAYQDLRVCKGQTRRFGFWVNVFPSGSARFVMQDLSTGKYLNSSLQWQVAFTSYENFGPVAGYVQRTIDYRPEGKDGSTLIRFFLEGANGATFWDDLTEAPESVLEERFSPSGYSSESDSVYQARVKDFPPILEDLSDEGALAAREITITVMDEDRRLARIWAGPAGDRIYGAAARVRLASPSVAPAAWRELFNGVIVKPIEYPEPHLAALTLRTEDRAMQRLFPSGGWLLSQAIWPNANPVDVGQLAPMVWGQVSSVNATLTGAVRLLHADTVAHRYIAAGKVGIVNVYDGGAIVALSAYKTYLETRGGRLWTVVDFVDPATGEVTADCEGYDVTNQAGTQTTRDPTLCLQHMLANFAFADWRSGDWLTTARFDGPRLAKVATQLGRRGHKAGYVLSERKTGYDVLNEWLETFQCEAFWTPEGKIAIVMEDNAELTIYPLTANRISHHDAGFSYEWDDQRMVSSVVGRYAFLLGTAQSAIEAAESGGGLGSDEIDMSWISAE